METPTYNQGIRDAKDEEQPGTGGLAVLPNEDQVRVWMCCEALQMEQSRAEDEILQP